MRHLTRVTTQKVLQLAVIFMFIGWGILHLFYDIPYRTLLWSHILVGWLVEGVLQIPWETYVTSMNVDMAIQNGIRFVGVLCLGIAFLAIRTQENSKVNKWVASGSGIIFVLALLHFKEAGLKWPMLLEFSGQFFAPLLLVMSMSTQRSSESLMNYLKLAIAFTFGSHGLYAIGFMPVPGHFIDMVISTLGTSESQARMILKIVGGLDLLLCVGVFLDKTERLCLFYALGWGFLTAMARPASYLEVTPNLNALAYWISQALYRVPHGALPLAALTLSYQMRSSEDFATLISRLFPGLRTFNLPDTPQK